MSAVIAPIAIDANTVEPTGGSTALASDGQSFAITSPDATGGTPATVTAPTTGTIFVAPATENANVVVNGAGNATIDLTNATLNGDPLNLGGSTVQVDENYSGSVTADFSGSVVDGTVDLNTATGNGSVADNAPAGASDVNFYLATGAGGDQIQGTVGNDFIRAGAGNDTIRASAGDDIVRVGAGNDTVTLGTGNDAVYFTVDQLQGQSTNTITDFDSGVDQILIDADLEGRVEITGQGTGDIVITLSGSETGTTTITSDGDAIQDDDIQFV